MIRKMLFALGLPLLLLLIAEVSLRLLGRPHGTFAGTELRGGLWEPNTSTELRFGPVLYRVNANSQGFRGAEFRGPDDPPQIRIAAIGDSMTDGFFVDDDATYPSLLQSTLQARGIDAEVVNASRGGGSIDTFARRLEELVLPLQPQVVIVSFVTNDLYDLELGDADSSALARFASRFVARTALGEKGMEIQLRLRGATQAQTADAFFGGHELVGDARYRIPGSERYSENAKLFRRRFRKVDGRLLAETLPPDVEATLSGPYQSELERFHRICEANGIHVLFVYFPAYPQLYLSGAPTAIQDRLAGQVTQLGIPFVDLTRALQVASRVAPVHLAPLDFHLNPRGNEAVAAEIARALSDHGLLPPTR